jgi:hypothetical protein
VPEAKFEKPPINVSPSGVAYVSAADILRSRAGREEIDKIYKIIVSRHIGRASAKDKEES